MAQGIALALAVLLGSAGLPKVWRPGHVAGALRRVFGQGRFNTVVLRRLGRLLGVWELVLAAAIVGVGGPLVGMAVAGTFVGFLGFVVVAVRRGASCGCWASFTEGPAGGAELARTGVLALGAGGAAAAGWVPFGFGWVSLGWAGVFLAVTWLATLVGGWTAPVRSARVARRLAMRAAPTRRGRAVARLAFLMGFVHAGTDAGRRRYLDALTKQHSAAGSANSDTRSASSAQKANA
ncbi:MauE/DoxX family redox-associated membrane protein [Actinophytocola sp.]|uniref:MauE/DoxX family redox-associated membrane protein n=1 Tax=Actinophytocola sp. TaxID=1872138 RepID=UPI002ED46D35